MDHGGMRLGGDLQFDRDVSVFSVYDYVRYEACFENFSFVCGLIYDTTRNN